MAKIAMWSSVILASIAAGVTYLLQHLPATTQSIV